MTALDDSPIYLLFRLQLPFVRGNERTNVVRHVEQLEPLLLVQSHGKPSHPIDREGALFTHFHASSGRCSLLEGGIFFAQTLELRFQIVRHASSSSPPPGGRAGLPPDTRWVADAQSGAATFSNRGIVRAGGFREAISHQSRLFATTSSAPRFLRVSRCKLQVGDTRLVAFASAISASSVSMLANSS